MDWLALEESGDFKVYVSKLFNELLEAVGLKNVRMTS